MGAGIEQRAWTPTIRRGPIAAEAVTPGPAIVVLPTLIGNKIPESNKHAAPAFTFGMKHKVKLDSVGPGPAQYDVSGLGNKGKEFAPAVSLQSRPKDMKRFITPSPVEYDVSRGEKVVNPTKPKYTFGVKSQFITISSSPAPNVYKIPNIMGSSREGAIKSAPAFTIVGRHKQPPPSTATYPGPGTYDGDYAVTMKKLPVYSVAPRLTYPEKRFGPGPAAHRPEKVVLASTYKSARAPSFGIRYSKYLGEPKFTLVPVECE